MQVNPSAFAKKARAAAESTAAEMQAVHGPFWTGRDDLTKLVLSLSSAILAGTISFSENILGSSSSPCAAWLLIVSWALFFGSICSGLASLWHANTLRSFRARFASSEPEMKQEVAELKTDTPEKLVEGVLAVVKKHSDAALQPLEPADKNSQRYAHVSILLFGGALAVFIVVGGLLVT